MHVLLVFLRIRVQASHIEALRSIIKCTAAEPDDARDI